MTNANDQAFPFAIDKSKQMFYGGLTKREYFAAMALQGLLNNTGWNMLTMCADQAVKQADKLINELNKIPNNE